MNANHLSFALVSTLLGVAGCCPNDDPRYNANGGCECTDSDGGALHVVPVTFCNTAPPSVGEEDPSVTLINVEVEDNSRSNRATPISANEDWFGTISDSADQDWFAISGADGFAGMILEVESLTADQGVMVEVGRGGSLYVDHPAGPEETFMMGFGSAFQSDHRFRILALDGAAPVDYRIRISFTDVAYEFEDNSRESRATVMPAGVPFGGLISTSADADWYRSIGPDGLTAVTWTVTHLQSYPTADVPLTVTTGRAGSQFESFTVNAGESNFVTMSSVFQDSHTTAISALEAAYYTGWKPTILPTGTSVKTIVGPAELL